MWWPETTPELMKTRYGVSWWCCKRRYSLEVGTAVIAVVGKDRHVELDTVNNVRAKRMLGQRLGFAAAAKRLLKS